MLPCVVCLLAATCLVHLFVPASFSSVQIEFFIFLSSGAGTVGRGSDKRQTRTEQKTKERKEKRRSRVTNDIGNVDRHIVVEANDVRDALGVVEFLLHQGWSRATKLNVLTKGHGVE